MLFVWFGYNKLGMKRVLREWLPILLGYKPAVDAYKVATGAKQEVGQAANPLHEMGTMKIIEMFTEAIPGVIIQLTAIATSDGVISTASWISLAFSALTTGFASATISYDFDTDPIGRQQTPDFYGYVPASAIKRSIIFASMTLFSAGMLLLRCMTIVVLGLMGGSWVALYFGVDLGFYLVVKILRGDFWYWVPLGGNAELIISMLNRVVVKVIVDFTSIVHLRHPYEVGGFYWAFGIVLTMGSLPVAIILSEKQQQETEGSRIAKTISEYLTPLALFCLSCFFLNIKKTFRITFYSFEKGKDLTTRNFRGTDEVKAQYSINRSRHHWQEIEKDVRTWVETNWVRWEDEKPEWLTDALKAMVPVEFIPTTGEARRRESVRRASVDAEAEGGLGGILRASIRRASIGGTIEGHVKVVPIERDN
jgi:hypothetical protein